MKHDPPDPAQARRQLEAHFRDELRRSVAEAPSFDELAAYVEGRLDPEARALIEERLSADATLRQEVEDLRELHARMARPRPAASRPGLQRTAVLAAALAAAASLFLWLSPASDDGTMPGSLPPLAPPPLATMSDGHARLVLAADGSLSGLHAPDARTRAAVAAALRGVLPAPQGVEALQSGPGTLLGTEAAPAFAPLAPVGTRVSADRPTFRWTAHPGARSYEVAVFDQDLHRSLASGSIAGTEWTPAQALTRGRVYLWQVTAVISRERVTAPAPPAPEARFEVAAPGLLAEVEGRRAHDPASHLVAALAFVEAGLLDEADAELRALAAQNPGSPEAERLHSTLLALRAGKPKPPR